MGAVENAYNIVFAAFLMAAAGIADVLGRRRVFIFGLALFTVGSLLCAIAPSAEGRKMGSQRFFFL